MIGPAPWHGWIAMQEVDASKSSVRPGVVRTSLQDYIHGLLDGSMVRGASDNQPCDQDEPPSPSHEGVSVELAASLAWSLAGVRLFSGTELPTLDTLSKAAQSVLCVVAIERFDGNITHMATALGTSRRALRQRLKTMGLYVEQDEPDEVQAGGESVESAPEEDDGPGTNSR